ncbi:cell division protein FtsI (penicillin-binding protein 3) [Capnocytophaga haemolytica]|uniref:Penicillin-binding protein n=1 Tax=Capnocytophaga haemolytica TaxID=45243 RepID=A0AAX2H059_9FLAO|nr:penicillin-binding protein [Capnocytophaga haemolytica]AMD84894.1 penicillin-binding protein [Capnocytophaga haemolytica]SFN77556.1 cell division protein FtsI (penicillin-binding protein 3) [Capnocytophaga haemolytica]SNV06595.1 Penicillin-binding protein 2 [Capnocytophaga haemolytica]
MGKKEKKITGRTFFVAGMMLAIGLFIAFKLIKLQIEGEAYRERVDETTLREADILPSQGNLYSDDGSLLATSVTRYTIRWDAVAPSSRDFNKLINPLCDSLSKMMGNSSSYYRNLFRKERLNKNRYMLVAHNLGYSEYIRIKRFPLFSKGPYKGGLIVERNIKREYPLGGIANRSIGYARTDETGYTTRVGLEGAYANYLLGTKGRRVEQKIAQGQWKLASGFNIIEPKDGYDVVSTININIQDIAHHALLTQLKKYKAKHGCVIVMEVSTGEIKAISNLELNPKNDTYSERYNFAVGEAHEPGSVFKLMTVVATLEKRAIDTTYTVDVRDGKVQYYDKTFQDSQHRFTGRISLSKAFAVSSNVGMTELVHSLFAKTPSDFTSQLLQMNLGLRLGLPILGEGEPFIPTPKDKMWSGVTLESMAIGYSVKITPLQSLAFYNAIANGGVMIKPRLIKEVREWNKVIEKYNAEIINSKICSPETARKAKGLLADVVARSYGSGHRLHSDDFSMAGKTGTARKNYASADKSKLSYISSFAGFFPVESPKYSCIVVIHEPDKSVGFYGADVSGPVFKSIAHKIYTNSLLMDTVDDVDKVSYASAKNYEDYYAKSAKFKTIMPDLRGMAAMDAVALLENMGCRVRLTGTGKVSTQSVAYGTKITPGTFVNLQCGTVSE